jgi:chromosome segregation ATPase
METLMPDRSTYRLYEDARLIEEAKYNPNRELAITLGERLADVLAEAEERVEEQRDRASDFERDANKLDDRIYELELMLDTLELMLDTRDTYIEELELQLAELKQKETN